MIFFGGVDHFFDRITGLRGSTGFLEMKEFHPVDPRNPVILSKNSFALIREIRG